MSEFAVWLMTIFGGVFGAVIGFIIIGLAAALLALPYFLFTRESRPKVEEANPFNDRYV